jgi:hypothetical protein
MNHWWMGEHGHHHGEHQKSDRASPELVEGCPYLQQFWLVIGSLMNNPGLSLFDIDIFCLIAL